MNNYKLAKYVSEETGIYIRDAKVLVEAVIMGISKGILEDKEVRLKDFGVFEVKVRKPKVGRNPKTGVMYPVPLRYKLLFRPSPLLDLGDINELEEE